MQRFDIINGLIKKYNYKSYLEIGTQGDLCLKEIVCNYKVGIDPKPVLYEEKNSNEFYRMTSDKFFKQNKKKFDIIFVDGLHYAEQVEKDINNSLLILNKGGSIVVHDCNPLTEEAQRIPYEHCATWNGNTWKAWVKLRAREDLFMIVINKDQGCGIIQRGKQKPLLVEGYLTYQKLEKNRKKWLNLKK